MQPDRFLLSGRIGRWRWPWAVAGTIATLSLIIALSMATEPLETWLAGRYGEDATGPELIPGRLDTYAGFALFALTLTLAPAIVVRVLHGLDPRRLLGPGGRLPWDQLLRASLALLLVMSTGLVLGLIREPQQYQWQGKGLGHLPWLLLALPVIFLQSFAEEYLFKGYLVRVWGAVLPVRSLIMLAIAGLFTAGHAINDDVAQDLAFNLMFFFAAEMLTLAIYLRTASLAAVTGLHWINNVWAMCVVATLPGQSSALSLGVYADPVLSAGGSRLADPYAYLEMLAGLGLLWGLLTWRQSPFHLPTSPTGTPPAAAVTAPSPP